MLPNPAKDNQPIFSAEIYSSKTEESGKESTLILNAKRVLVPNISTSIASLGDHDIVSGYIAKVLDEYIDYCIQEIEQLKTLGFVRLMHDDKPYPQPQIGRMVIKNNQEEYADIQYYSPGQELARVELRTRGDYTPETKQVTGTFNISVLNGDPDMDRRVASLQITSSSTLESQDRYSEIGFFDIFHKYHVIADETTLDTIRFENWSGLPHAKVYPVIIQDVDKHGEIVYKFQIKDVDDDSLIGEIGFQRIK